MAEFLVAKSAEKATAENIATAETTASGEPMVEFGETPAKQRLRADGCLPEYGFTYEDTWIPTVVKVDSSRGTDVDAGGGAASGTVVLEGADEVQFRIDGADLTIIAAGCKRFGHRRVRMKVFGMSIVPHTIQSTKRSQFDSLIG